MPRSAELVEFVIVRPKNPLVWKNESVEAQVTCRQGLVSNFFALSVMAENQDKISLSFIQGSHNFWR